VFVVATLIGIVRPNDPVLRNSLIGETIPPQHLMGAVGLSRATMDSARVAGAPAGAGLSTVLGIGPAYLLITTLYLTSGALTFGVARRHPVSDPGEAPRAASPGITTVAMPSPSRGRDLKDGLLHVLRMPDLLAPMWLAFLINLTAYPVSNGLLPYVAKNVYAVGATGLGWLVASFAFGGLLGSIATIVTGGPRRPERFVLVCTVIWYAVLLGFGHVGNLRAGLCPGNHESVGKHRSGRTRHGYRWLRAALIEAALAASVRSTKGAFAARYRRIMPPRGHKKAVVAVAHAMLITAYHLLARHTTYQDPGSDYYDRRHADAARGGPSRHSNVRASGSPSNPRPEHGVNFTGNFLSNACSRTRRPWGGPVSPCGRPVASRADPVRFRVTTHCASPVSDRDQRLGATVRAGRARPSVVDRYHLPPDGRGLALPGP
jgi:hypothetical protein